MDYQTVSVPGGRLLEALEVMTPILQADGVINLAKLKTHMFMTFTGATKNLFGVIPGLNKASYHARLADPDALRQYASGLAYFVRPRLNIVDGYWPSRERARDRRQPRPLGVLVAGATP